MKSKTKSRNFLFQIKLIKLWLRICMAGECCQVRQYKNEEVVCLFSFQINLFFPQSITGSAPVLTRKDQPATFSSVDSNQLVQFLENIIKLHGEILLNSIKTFCTWSATSKSTFRSVLLTSQNCS